jgi:uncharacterized protein (TIGR02596 family)
MNGSAQTGNRGFTVLEMIVVISILVTLLALIVPALHSLSRASHLTMASATIVDELNFARQTALARNRVVEVRFYSLRHEIDPHRSFRAVATFVSDESGSRMQPLGPVKRFPISVAALDDEKYSTLLSDTTRAPVSDEVEDLPNAPSTPYKCVRFRPTGGAELSAYTSTSDNWFLTVKNETDRSYPDRPADNYVTIQLDPFTGRTRQFRP